MGCLTKADPEIAAATFRMHLDTFWASGRPNALGMERMDLDPLHSVIGLRAARPGMSPDRYFVKLGAEFYDSFPPTVLFVMPAGESIWKEATYQTRWFPTITFPPGRPAWFGLHHSYQYQDGNPPRQLVCFSFTAEYYMSNHSPKETERWAQGRHTVAATLNRLNKLLQPPLYQGPSGETW